jgi:siroheme synthase
MGKVYLVGAGPGDPELLSLKAYRLIKEADVILIDNLVLGVKELIPDGKVVIDTGKTAKKHKYSQDAINALCDKRALSRPVGEIR